MIKRLLIATLPCIVLSACGGGEDYDPALLEQYLRAIPSSSTLEANYPEASQNAKQLAEVGDPAMFPQQAVPIAQTINETIRGMLDLLETVVQHPPTAYNSETLEFVWGPMDNGDSELADDTVYVYIRDNGDSADFRYSYAFLRGMSNDVATMVPVIWGAHNPDPDNEDYGNGVALWDFEANYEFEEANNPDHGDLTRGRFAATFSKGIADDATSKEVTLVVAAFRDFLPEDSAEGSEPSQLDYLWGKVTDSDQRFDFLDFEYPANLEGTSTEELEDFGMRLAFYNTGIGRAEADASDGDLTTDWPGYHVEATECWDAALARTYLNLEAVPDDPSSEQPVQTFGTEGEATNCAMDSLDEVPSLDDVNPELLDALSDLALNGVQ